MITELTCFLGGVFCGILLCAVTILFITNHEMKQLERGEE